MKWIKINSNSDLPPFNKLVLTRKDEKNKDGDTVSKIGLNYLNSIDEEGHKWSSQKKSESLPNYNNFNDVFNILNAQYITNVDYWCDITINKKYYTYEDIISLLEIISSTLYDEKAMQIDSNYLTKIFNNNFE